MYTIIFSKSASTDKALLKAAGLAGKVQALLALMMENPYRTPPSYEKLSGELKGFYSRRLNRQHRLIYSVDEDMKIIHVLRMWTHYE